MKFYQAQLGLFAIALCYAPIKATAVNVDTCVRYDDASKIVKLRQHLDESSTPNYVNDKTAICVRHKDKEDLLNLARALFPPNHKSAKYIYINEPDSPSGIPLESTKILDHKLHQELKKELTKQNIWFKEDENENIWYEVTNRQKVNDLTLQLFQKRK